jgi:hypothetical protein
VGSYPIVPSLVDPANRQTNYTVTLANGTLTVAQATPFLTWAKPAPITYGTDLDTNELNATANAAGNFAYNPTNGAVLNTGTNTLFLLFTPEDPVDYSSVTEMVNLVVSPTPLTVTAANANRVYGQANPAFTGAIAGVTNGDNITVTYASSATTSSAIGAYPIVPSLLDPADRQTNYTITLANGTLTVNPAALTITADNRTKTYGQTVVFAGTEFTTEGLLNGNSVASVTLTSSGTAAAATVAGSPYSIVPSAAIGNGLGNYTINYVNGELTVVGLTQPSLDFVFEPPNVMLSWPTNASAFVLSRTPSLASPITWTPVTSGISVNGTNNTITINASGGNQYYKLIAP